MLCTIQRAPSSAAVRLGTRPDHSASGFSGIAVGEEFYSAPGQELGSDWQAAANGAANWSGAPGDWTVSLQVQIFVVS